MILNQWEIIKMNVIAQVTHSFLPRRIIPTIGSDHDSVEISINRRNGMGTDIRIPDVGFERMLVSESD